MKSTLREARLNAEAAGTLVTEDPAQRRLFAVIGWTFTVTLSYTVYRIVRGLVRTFK